MREGNPGGRPLDPGVVFPPVAPVEPDWQERFPGSSDGESRLRARCAELWTMLGETLHRSVGLTLQQQHVLEEFVTCVARIEQCERQLSIDGLIINGQRGPVRNPIGTFLNQYRAQLRGLTAELGLSPATAARLTVRPSEDEDDVFDTPESIAASLRNGRQ
ncbi:P27 family phage terminase small subunit [Arthrobacter sp. B1805]|uniref:P27 family phage terminase small subunit n=1 Tax=Arthrobacter sp. B1805 TaxID=2058892 RepID=UPI0011B0C36F|nr:P27 family phage terminase small subunit [Arthrobacter sp. B1805]